jgi:hypothetical protein
VVDCRQSRRIYPAQALLHFRRHCERNLVQDAHRLAHRTNITEALARKDLLDVAKGDLRGDAQPAIFTSTSGSRALGGFLDADLETEEPVLPFGRRLFHHPPCPDVESDRRPGLVHFASG